MPLDYLPPMVILRNELDSQDVTALQYGDAHHILEPGETVTFPITWDRTNAKGDRVPPGQYSAQTRVANTAYSFWVTAGPRAQFVLLP